MLPLNRAAAVVLLAALLCGGCVPGPRRRAERPALPASSAALEAGARETLEALAAAYQANDIERFVERVDDHLFPDFISFRERLRDSLRDDRQINLDIVVDTVSPGTGEVSITAHWNEGWVGKDGRHRSDKGRCELMFRLQPSGAMALAAIRGDSPF